MLYVRRMMFIWCCWLPLQLALMGQGMVWFWMRYALRVVSDGDLRSVSSSFFHTYVIADCSYDTEIRKSILCDKTISQDRAR